MSGNPTQNANAGREAGLTGAIIKQHQAEVKRQVMTIVDDIHLRKWAVEQTVKIANDTDNLYFDEIQKITKFFYDFVAPKKEIPDAERA